MLPLARSTDDHLLSFCLSSASCLHSLLLVLLCLCVFLRLSLFVGIFVSRENFLSRQIVMSILDDPSPKFLPPSNNRRWPRWIRSNSSLITLASTRFSYLFRSYSDIAEILVEEAPFCPLCLPGFGTQARDPSVDRSWVQPFSNQEFC